MSKFFVKERKLLDSKDISIKSILQHSAVNWLYGFTSGIALAFVTLFINNTNVTYALYLFIAYFIHKQVESKILNRNKYTTKLARNYIFPIPSTIGFVLGAYLSTIIMK